MRRLLGAATMALCLFVMTINVAVAKPKAIAGHEAVTRPLPLLVALSATNGSLDTDADGTTSLTLTGLDDLALRVSGGEAIPMTLPVFASAFGPLFGGRPVNGLLSVDSAEPAGAPARLAFELDAPVFDQEALVMTFPATSATWSIEHPAAINLPVEPDLVVEPPRDLGPLTLVMSGDSVRSATMGPLEILVSPAADGRSVGVLALSEGATVISSRATPDAPYLSFFGMLSDGSTVEGVIEATFARGGGRLTATDIKVSGPTPTTFSGLLATW